MAAVRRPVRRLGANVLARATAELGFVAGAFRALCIARIVVGRSDFHRVSFLTAQMRYRLRTLLILLAVGLPFAGCGVRVGGGGIGASEWDDVIFYPPGPEIQKARNNAKVQPTTTP